MSKRDYYEILGLAKNSTADDIKQAYRRMAMKYHPDRNKEAGAEDKFKEINEAYETLSDPEKKAIYDQYGDSYSNPFTHNTSHQGRSRTWTFDPDDMQNMRGIFEEIFGRDYDSKSTQTNTKKVSVINISLKDAYTGRTIRHDAKTSVNIPAGVRTGARLYVDGKLFRIEVVPDAKFKRSLDDLMTEVSITAIEAMLGIDATLEHLDGAKFQFNIPSGIQSGQIVRLSRKGMKNPETSAIGDLLIRINVTIPKDLSDAEKEAIKVISHRDSITI